MWSITHAFRVFFARRFRQTSNTSRTAVSNKIVDHSDVVGGAAPTTSSFSTQHLDTLHEDNWKTSRDTLNFLDFVRLIKIAIAEMLKDMWKIGWYQTATKYYKAATGYILPGVYWLFKD